MNDSHLIFEAGVYYCFPHRDEDNPPVDMQAYRYDRFRNGKRYGTGRVFVLGRQPIDFHKLIESWNRKGVNSGYCYVGLVG